MHIWYGNQIGKHLSLTVSIAWTYASALTFEYKDNHLALKGKISSVNREICDEGNLGAYVTCQIRLKCLFPLLHSISILSDSLPSVSRSCRQWGIVYSKQAYGPPRPITGTFYLFICRWYSYLTGNTLCNNFTSLYVDDIRTSQETHFVITLLLYM
jgi:hypothetical protein